MEPLKQWFSTKGDFVPLGKLAMPGDISNCHNWGGGGGGLFRGTEVKWLEARYATEHSAMHSIAQHSATIKHLSK